MKLTVKGLTFGSPEYVRIAKLGEKNYEAIERIKKEDE
jgi:hypothetical protein